MTLSKPVSNAAVNPLESLAMALKGEMASINALIIDRMQSDIPLIPQLAGHLIAGGGKRIRPLLMLAAAKALGYAGDRHYKLAASVEFIHTATLLHDDVVDESDQRRGKASANALFGNEAAVLVGDFLFTRSFQLMVEDGDLEVLRVLSKASATIAEGEVLQLSTANNIDATEAEYLRVIDAKTAELFAAACETGAIVAGATAEQQKALRDYGAYLGMAFQISDDILDYTADAKRLGKSVGDDFKEGKMTLPVIKALQKADTSERDFWQRCMVELDQTDLDLIHAKEILKKHDTIAQSLRMAQDYVARGQAALKLLLPHPICDDLSALIEFAANRDY